VQSSAALSFALRIPLFKKMENFMKRLSLLLLLSGLIINASATEIYRCQDEEGNIIYTQTPSAACLEKVDLPTEQSITSDTKTEVQKDSEENAPPSGEKAATPPTRTLEENCKIANQQLQLFNSKRPLMKPDKENQGKFIVLTDKMRQQEKAKMQAYVDKYCAKKESEEE